MSRTTRKQATVADVTAARERDEKATEDRKAAEAEKAEAEKARTASLVTKAKAALDVLVQPVQAAASVLRSAQLDLGVLLLQAEAIITEAGTALDLTVQRWAEAIIPEDAGVGSGIGWGSSPAYRSLQAARVAAAASRKGLDIGSTAVTALVPMHRLLSLDNGDEAVAAVFKAAKGRGRKAPTAKAISEALTSLYPEAQGTRGPAKGKGRNGRKGTVSKAQATQAVQAVTQAISEATEAVQAVDPDASVVQAAASDLGRVLAAHVQEFGKDAYGPAWTLVRETVRLCHDHSVPAVQAAIRLRDEKAQAAEKAQAEKAQAEAEKAPATAEKATTRTTRTTRTKAPTAKAAKGRTTRTTRTTRKATK